MPMRPHLLFLIVFAAIMAIDAIVLSFVLKDFFATQLAPFARTLRIWSAIATWALIALGTVLFVVPQSNGYGSAALYGALFGLIVYGVYDLTNYAILAQYPPLMVAVDITWGVTLCTSVSLFAFFIGKRA